MESDESNPFGDKEVARQWIRSVEVSDEFRESQIYPRLVKWQSTFNAEVLVEIGSGQGICSAQVVEFPDGTYIGIEPSIPLIDRARELYQEDWKEFRIGEASELPLLDSSAEGVFSVNVWLHLENIVEPAHELYRVLKPDGRFLIITANPKQYDAWKALFFERTQSGKRLTGGFHLPNNDLSRHTMYLHTLEELLESLEKANLIVSTTEYFGADGSQDSTDYFVAVEGFKREQTGSDHV